MLGAGRRGGHLLLGLAGPGGWRERCRFFFRSSRVLRENNLRSGYGAASVFFLIYNALSERSENGRRVPAPAVLALVVTVLLGWLDEGIQAFLPDRVYDNFRCLFQHYRGGDRDWGECGDRVGAAADRQMSKSAMVLYPGGSSVPSRRTAR